MWDTQIRLPSDLGADESLRTESGRAAVGVVRATVVLAGLLFASPAATASDVGPGGDVAFSGQVIERETGKPVGAPESFWSVPSVALRRGRRRLGPARASFGPTKRGDSASSFRPNRWPSRDFLSR